MNFKRFLFLVRVEGFSCWPYLKPGARYLATSFLTPQKGDFVVFRDKNNQKRFLVKKVIAKEKGGYRLASTLKIAKTGDNFGLVPAGRIEGKLIYVTQGPADPDRIEIAMIL